MMIANFIEPRFNNLVEGTLLVGGRVLLGVRGLGVGAISILTAGAFVRVNKIAAESLRDFGYIFSGTLASVVEVINPNASFPNYPQIDGYQQGYCCKRVCGIYLKVFEKTDEFPLVARHISTKLTEPVAALAFTVASIMDALMGIVAIPFPIITLGTDVDINEFAYWQLAFPLIIQNIYVCALRFINPDCFGRPSLPNNN